MSVYAPGPIPKDEEARLKALAQMAVLNAPPDETFDIIVDLAAHLFQVPIALVSLIGESTQIFRARFGLDICETSRDASFCTHAIMDPERIFVIPDALQDARFINNPLVTGSPHIRFYAGVPLIGLSSQPIGTLCIIDRSPRSRLSEHEEVTLRKLARMTIVRMMTRTVLQQLDQDRAA
jgi:GAF domain-containing protein